MPTPPPAVTIPAFQGLGAKPSSKMGSAKPKPSPPTLPVAKSAAVAKMKEKDAEQEPLPQEAPFGMIPLAAIIRSVTLFSLPL